MEMTCANSLSSKLVFAMSNFIILCADNKPNIKQIMKCLFPVDEYVVGKRETVTAEHFPFPKLIQKTVISDYLTREIIEVKGLASIFF